MPVSGPPMKNGAETMKKLLAGVAILLTLAPGAALAGHGKAGLWNVTTTLNMAAALPPAALAQMKKSGVKMPASQTMSSQMCMTQADVDASSPPAMADHDPRCVTHVTSQSASAMTSEMVCKGKMAGTGRTQIAYNGAEHYAGSYSFSGRMDGRPVNSSMLFRGDWVRADCGKVKPAHP